MVSEGKENFQVFSLGKEMEASVGSSSAASCSRKVKSISRWEQMFPMSEKSIHSPPAQISSSIKVALDWQRTWGKYPDLQMKHNLYLGMEIFM